ncbi:hypothetical protein AMD27_14695 [Acinetobacter sp. TGL-Y2]|uniref:hypothetical protein n=1 Tax=Acinetobacter sp. TGL-Y2 TaxID=1407071 RepID=UPI0007A65421|nr:hypothetical protein [Acinetobacter sp. TGL-Y2]AMW80029.1 hypothetical protein AMD27_14695 [Acinetobacter sp. TGL-Y2]
MKTSLYQTICFSLFLGFVAQTTQAAALQKTSKAVHAPLSIEKNQSPIERALSQQKRNRSDSKLLAEQDQMKVITSISVAPTQNFFASQNQRFSRFVQAIFL